ncbi:D-glycero-beta-D-manno-heptose 1-phosphate adenylyltransferase [candidate division KSB1 bacterium]
MNVLSKDQAIEFRKISRSQGRKVVFTNGCFDILHRGHIDYLFEASKLGDVLIVGINTDESVRRIKDTGRPIVSEEDRAFIIAALRFVDAVCLFEEDTPLELIRSLMPDVLVKGSDYEIDDIVGSKEVLNNGGDVKTITLVSGRSTTNIINRIKGLPD